MACDVFATPSTILRERNRIEMTRESLASIPVEICDLLAKLTGIGIARDAAPFGQLRGRIHVTLYRSIAGVVGNHHLHMKEADRERYRINQWLVEDIVEVCRKEYLRAFLGLLSQMLDNATE
jgi:hypothetical protein